MKSRRFMVTTARVCGRVGDGGPGAGACLSTKLSTAVWINAPTADADRQAKAT